MQRLATGIADFFRRPPDKTLRFLTVSGRPDAARKIATIVPYKTSARAGPRIMSSPRRPDNVPPCGRGAGRVSGVSGVQKGRGSAPSGGAIASAHADFFTAVKGATIGPGCYEC
jgi:hypothetical protein